MSLTRLAGLFLAICCAPGFAHEDRVLRLADDGTLAGLPAPYSPAHLALRFANVDGERRLTSLALDIRGQHTSLPTCALGLVNTQGIEDVRVLASWDHDEAVLPYYLQIRLLDPGQDPRSASASGFSLLFNLRTTRLMQMEVNIVRSLPPIEQSVPVDLRVRCSPEEFDGFWTGIP